jgi:hypothetical protein
MKLIGSDSKIRVDESGIVKEFYWGDTLSSVLYVQYSEFAKKTLSEYLKNKKIMIAEYLSYCDEADYTEFQNSDGDFAIFIDKLFKENKIQKEVGKYLSSKFELSSFKTEVLNLEAELSTSDKVTDDILPF